MKMLSRVTTRTLAAAVLAVAAGTALVPQVQAAPTLFCKDYARAAVNQYKRNLVKGCGYAGWRWHGWKGGHYKWCKHTSKGAAMSERVVRWRMLGQCW